MLKTRISMLAVATFLAACGGGGSDGGTTQTGASAEGLRSGTTSTGYAFSLLTLENGEFWGIYGKNNLLYGAVQGSASWDGKNLNGSGTDFYLYGGTRSDGTVAGTYTNKGSLTGTLSGTAAATFTGTYDSRYDIAAAPSDLTGTWTISAAASTGVTTSSITISAAGAITGSNQFCTINGTAVPRATGKNVFNLSVTFAGANCLFNGKGLTGVAVLLKSGTARQLTVAALLPDRSDGFVGIASK